jgi:hypothetical protein
MSSRKERISIVLPIIPSNSALVSLPSPLDSFHLRSHSPLSLSLSLSLCRSPSQNHNPAHQILSSSPWSPANLSSRPPNLATLSHPVSSIFSSVESEDLSTVGFHDLPSAEERRREEKQPLFRRKLNLQSNCERSWRSGSSQTTDLQGPSCCCCPLWVCVVSSSS